MTGKGKALLGSLLLALGCAEEPALEEERASEPTPMLLAVGEAVFEAGVVRPGEILRQRFHFLNASGRTLEIGALRQSCGCSKAVLSSSVLAPGEIGEIDVEADTYQRSGAFRADVELLERSESPHAWLTVSIVAEVLPSFLLTIEPALLELGEVVPAAWTEFQVTLRSVASLGAEPIRPVLRQPGPGLGCRFEREDVVSSETRRTLEVLATISLDLSGVAGRFERRAVFAIEPPNESPRTATLLIRGAAVGFARLEPEELYTGPIECHERTTRTVAVHLREGQATPSLTTSQAWIAASFEDRPASGALRLRLTLTPPEGRGFLEEWVELSSGGSSLRLPVRGILR